MFVVGTLGCPQISAADLAENGNFAQWNQDAQEAFLQNTVIMASVVSSRSNPAHGDCISNWLFDPSGMRKEVKSRALETIAEYSEHRPSAVLVALMEEACGPFGAAD